MMKSGSYKYLGTHNHYDNLTKNKNKLNNNNI